MSEEVEMEKKKKKKKESVEPFIRANPYTGQWEPVVEEPQITRIYAGNKENEKRT